MILVTDGEDLEREGVQKAADLAKAGVLVYSVGVGTPEGQALELPGGGASESVRDPQGRAVTSRLDEETLRAIAVVTGGTYEPLGTLGQGFARVNERIDAALDLSQGEDLNTRGIDRFHWFLGGALLFLVGESLIGTRRRLSDTAKV
jgi:Ca-activated chloride channel family protein